MCSQAFTNFALTSWPWNALPLQNTGAGTGTFTYDNPSNTLSLFLNAFQVRVFTV